MNTSIGMDIAVTDYVGIADSLTISRSNFIIRYACGRRSVARLVERISISLKMLSQGLDDALSRAERQNRPISIKR